MLRLRSSASLLLLGACVVFVGATLIAHPNEALSTSALAVYVAAAVIVAVAVSLLLSARSDLDRQREELEQERLQIEQLQRTIEDDLLEQQQQLDRREEKLADRLLTYHEWMEFPTPVQIEDEQRSVAAQDALRQMAERDRALNQLLSERSEQLFDDILNNKYAQDGEVDVKLMRDDAYALAERVARLYRSDADTPLLETSFEQVLRAVSKSCLQLLTLLDELPLDVKQRNINDLYGYVRQAVRAYGVYKAAEPYWPYFNSAYFLARFAMGANPLTLGAWWFAGSMSRRAAQALTTRVVNRQALALLHQVVRVIGYEVANVYGAGFQHRDANWIYATELCELLRSLPGSHESLTKALQEISSLQLRSEYDRIFLYRCLTSRNSASPERYRALDVLNAAEREAVVRRLERFVTVFAAGASPKKLQSWHKGVETRLDVKVEAPEIMPVDPEAQLALAITSLAGFLLEIKQVDERELLLHLRETKAYQAIPEERRRECEEQLKAHPPFFFELPDLPPESDLTRQFLDDLTHLSVRLPPHTADIDELLENAAAYLRQGKRLVALRQQHFDRYLDERFAPHPAPEKLSAKVARAVLDLVGDEQAQFLAGNIEIRGGDLSGNTAEQLWLLRLAERLLLFSVGDAPQLLWRGEQDTVLELTKGYLSDEVEITGGNWLSAQPAEARIVVPIGRLQRNHPHAKQLAELSKSQAEQTDELGESVDDS